MIANRGVYDWVGYDWVDVNELGEGYHVLYCTVSYLLHTLCYLCVTFTTTHIIVLYDTGQYCILKFNVNFTAHVADKIIFL